MLALTSQPFFIPSVLFLFLCTPLIFKLIPPNRFYGVRTKKTLADKDTWYRVNMQCGWIGIISSLIYLGVMFAVPYHKEFSIFLVHLAAFAGPWGILILYVRKR